MKRKRTVLLDILLSVSLFLPLSAQAQTTGETDSIMQEHELRDVVVKATHGTRSHSRVESVDIIGQSQLIRAACCNLGESFTTNPSVDVSYSDAATGARQIKLLGLSGTYVQMLTENVPNLEGQRVRGQVPDPSSPARIFLPHPSSPARRGSTTPPKSSPSQKVRT